jgi:hypothetical protein
MSSSQSLQSMIPEFVDYINSRAAYTEHNEKLFMINEGDLLTYVMASLKDQFKDSQSFDQVKHRVAPINVLKRIVQKLSKIYMPPPLRTIENGTAADTELLAWFEDELKVNQKMNTANEFFNLFKSTLIEPYVYDGEPHLRIIPSNQFLVYSNNTVETTKPTHVITTNGYKMNAQGLMKPTYRIYSDEEFVLIDSDGKVLGDEMTRLKNPMGINLYGKLPFVYVNRSQNLLMPVQDTDSLKLTTLIPILLSDLNYAVMFQAFSIIYGIDLDDESLKMAPNAFWRLKSLGDGEKKPEIGSIKPQVDIQAVLELIQSQFVFWLNTIGIKPGSIGSLGKDNFASGISKIVDEMDTFEVRQSQVEYFKNAEEDLWCLLFETMQPYWISTGAIEQTGMLSMNAEVCIEFAPQEPMADRAGLVDTLQKEVAAGFNSRWNAIKTLNPRFTDAQVQALIDEIDEERNSGMDQTLEEGASDGKKEMQKETGKEVEDETDSEEVMDEGSNGGVAKS